jgi:predicted RNA-binding protein with PUA-like domain
MLAGNIVQVRPERKALSAAVGPTCCSGREQRSKTAFAGGAIPITQTGSSSGRLAIAVAWDVPLDSPATESGVELPMNHWLFKSEPASFSIDDLGKRPKQTTAWDGVRNYQARNMLRDSIKKGDLAFFYYSSCDVPGIAGIVSIARDGYPDLTAFDPKNDHYDPDSKKDAPSWYVVDVKLMRKFKRIITLDELRTHASGALKDFVLLRRGNRLSVMPVTKKDWDFILALE